MSQGSKEKRRSFRLALIACAGIAIGALAVLGALGYRAALPPKPGTPEAGSEDALPQTPIPPRDLGILDDPAPIPPAASLPPWRRFAAAYPPAGGRARVAVVIDDLGIDRRRTTHALALPPPLTLAFLSYAPDLRQQTRKGTALGHELLVHVPMAPESGAVDPGPKVLTPELSEDEILRRLDWHLGQFPGYVGINNHMGSRFMAAPAAVRVVLREIKMRGLMFLDSRTSAESVANGAALGIGVPFAERQIFLDPTSAPVTLASVAGWLAKLEARARQDGQAIAIGHPKDATLAALARWIPTLHERGLVLVPVSALVRSSAEAG